ncbi:MAG TPA: hypothetical protein VMX77_00230 [Candidatus Bathyarchaeia archaeon]|nr:hypothetical protein [Candidatus Bathyarchaeia archaeon]
MPAQEKNSTLKTEKPQRGELKTLLSWQSAARPFKKRDREYFTTIGAIVFLLAVILLFLKEWLLIAVIIALMFVAYILSSVPPEEVDHQVTTRGIKTGNRHYDWEDLGSFWFSERWKQAILHVGTKLRFPGQLLILLGSQDKEEIKNVLGKHLDFTEPEPTWMDNAAGWLSRKVPLEKSS